MAAAAGRLHRTSYQPCRRYNFRGFSAQNDEFDPPILRKKAGRTPIEKLAIISPYQWQQPLDDSIKQDVPCDKTATSHVSARTSEVLALKMTKFDPPNLRKMLGTKTPPRGKGQ